MIKLTREDYNILCDALCFATRQVKKAIVNGDIPEVDLETQIELAKKCESIHKQFLENTGKIIINLAILTE